MLGDCRGTPHDEPFACRKDTRVGSASVVPVPRMTKDKDGLVAPMIEECSVLSDVSVMPMVYAP
jgi:hypothetical protein